MMDDDMLYKIQVSNSPENALCLMSRFSRAKRSAHGSRDPAISHGHLPGHICNWTQVSILIYRSSVQYVQLLSPAHKNNYFFARAFHKCDIFNFLKVLLCNYIIEMYQNILKMTSLYHHYYYYTIFLSLEKLLNLARGFNMF